MAWGKETKSFSKREIRANLLDISPEAQTTNVPNLRHSYKKVMLWKKKNPGNRRMLRLLILHTQFDLASSKIRFSMN
jgi:hypothetical protein